MLRFTEFIDVQYAAQGVLAYSIHPGAIETDMNASMPADYRTVLVDTLELPAHTLLWLVNERREWLAGRYVSCGWDMEEFLSKKDEIVQGDKLKHKLVV